MDIDKDAPAVAIHQIAIEAPAEKVWRLIVEVNRWPEWNPAVKAAKLGAPLGTGAAFTWKSGGVSIESTVREFEPMRRLVWTGKAIGTNAIHVWSLEAAGGGVMVTTSESFDGWLVRLMRRSMQSTLDKSLAAWLGELKREAERGRA